VVDLSSLVLTLAPPSTRHTARATYTAVCVFAGSLAVAVLAQVSIRLPFTPVPITGQTLGVLVVGAAFGPGLGALTLGAYLLEGVIGLPVFAPQADGAHLTGPSALSLGSATGGYLWGFLVAAAVVGWLSRRGWDRTLGSAIGAMFVGELVIYTIGLPWLAHALPALVGGPVTASDTLQAGLYPFIVGDAIKLLIAAGLLPLAWHAIRRLRGSTASDDLSPH
jgi:biotin transport system substrate-specific component